MTCVGDLQRCLLPLPQRTRGTSGICTRGKQVSVSGEVSGNGAFVRPWPLLLSVAEATCILMRKAV